MTRHTSMTNISLFIGGVEVEIGEGFSFAGHDTEGHGKSFADLCKPISMTLKIGPHSKNHRLLKKFLRTKKAAKITLPTTGPRNRWGVLQ